MAEKMSLEVLVYERTGILEHIQIFITRIVAVKGGPIIEEK